MCHLLIGTTRDLTFLSTSTQCDSIASHWSLRLMTYQSELQSSALETEHCALQHNKTVLERKANQWEYLQKIIVSDFQPGAHDSIDLNNTNMFPVSSLEKRALAHAHSSVLGATRSELHSAGQAACCEAELKVPV